MSKFDFESDKNFGRDEFTPQNIARFVFGEFSVSPDEGSEGQYARLRPDDIPPLAGGIALSPPGSEPMLELNQRG